MHNHAHLQNANILLVEDDEIDIETVQRVFKKAGITAKISTARDGVEGLEALRGENGHKKMQQPCIILLDINMPRMNGFQFLQNMREDAYMRQNVVFMLTTSARNADRSLAYDHSAAGYVLKENVSDLADILNRYCKINKFPEAAAG